MKTYLFYGQSYVRHQRDAHMLAKVLKRLETETEPVSNVDIYLNPLSGYRIPNSSTLIRMSQIAGGPSIKLIGEHGETTAGIGLKSFTKRCETGEPIFGIQ
jgi:hypothetical protein